MYERFSPSARYALQLANPSCQRFDHYFEPGGILPLHVLYGILQIPWGGATDLFAHFGMDTLIVRNQVIETLSKIPGMPGVLMGKIQQQPETKQIIEYAIQEATHAMESGSNNTQALVVETKPFLLYHLSSQSFLSGETRDIRDRFRLDDPSSVSYMILAGVGVLFLLLYTITQLVELSSPALRTPNTQERIVGAVIAIFALLNYMLRKNEKNTAFARMIQHGQVLQGVIVSSKGRNEGNGEEYWYEVEIVFRF